MFRSASERRSRAGSLLIGLLVLVGLVVVVGACGAGEPDRDPIRLQANAVGGGQVFYEDLASEDTVLWFWAPW